MINRVEFAQFYRNHYPSVYGFMLKRALVVEVAEDLTGEVFYKAWKNRGSFRYNVSPRAWLFRIARNTLIDYWRKRRETTLDSAEISQVASTDPSLQEASEQTDRLWRISKALDNLTGTMQSVAMLRFVEGLSAKEVAEILNLSEGNVRVIQFRALAELRRCLSDDII